MADLTAELLVDCKNQLGEGIQWNADHQRVFWTDIYGNKLASCDENGGDYKELALAAGLCAFAFQTPERLIAAFTDGLYWLDLASGARDLIRAYQPDLVHTRMNDGGLDRQGRFIVGGIDEQAMAPITPVWSVGSDGVREIIPQVGCANSLVFSPDGATMYFADTAGPDLYRFDYDPETGTPSNKRFFARLGEDGGLPDGSTVDAEGGLWSSRFGGWRVQRFLPGGAADTVLRLPVPNVTCCAIGGKEMNRMFVTTARILMEEEALRAMPQAGGIFAAELSVAGIAPGRFACDEVPKDRKETA